MPHYRTVHYYLILKGFMTHRFVSARAGGVFLAACDPYTIAAIVVTAPIWVPIAYANSQSGVVQPVAVVNASGKAVVAHVQTRAGGNRLKVWIYPPALS